MITCAGHPNQGCQDLIPAKTAFVASSDIKATSCREAGASGRNNQANKSARHNPRMRISSRLARLLDCPWFTLALALGNVSFVSLMAFMHLIQADAIVVTLIATATIQASIIIIDCMEEKLTRRNQDVEIQGRAS